MKIIGLTGGIASGKSTVTKALQDLGAIIIDADEISHGIIEPHKPAWEDIVKTYGDKVLNPDLSINRDKLGEIVFNNEQRLIQLNNITHPRVMEAIKGEVRKIKAAQANAVVVMDIPLLYETNAERIYDEVWVVWVDRETQMRRLMERNGFSKDEAVKRIEAQIPLEEKAKRADIVIDNCGSREETIRSATRYFNDILQKS